MQSLQRESRALDRHQGLGNHQGLPLLKLRHNLQPTYDHRKIVDWCLAHHLGHQNRLVTYVRCQLRYPKQQLPRRHQNTLSHRRFLNKHLMALLWSLYLLYRYLEP